MTVSLAATTGSLVAILVSCAASPAPAAATSTPAASRKAAWYETESTRKPTRSAP
jgi:hypothetical protein